MDNIFDNERGSDIGYLSDGAAAGSREGFAYWAGDPRVLEGGAETTGIGVYTAGGGAGVGQPATVNQDAKDGTGQKRQRGRRGGKKSQSSTHQWILDTEQRNIAKEKL